MTNGTQEYDVYRILMDLVEAAAHELKETAIDTPIPMKELTEVTRLYCMLKDGLRDDIKVDVWEKMQPKG